MINAFRRLLIRGGKSLPFILCALIAVSCLEMAVSLATESFVYYNGYYILDTPISFAVGQFFEYDVLIVIITLIISISIEACKWNLWATFYIGVHLAEKSYFTFELEIWQIWAIICGNFIVSVLFCCKGIKILVK
jgi:hypothetical protein